MKNFAQSVRNFIHEWTVNIAILLFGTTTLVQAFIVPTPSMDTSVQVGDHLLVDKLSYAPDGPITKHLLPYTPVKRGDIIVFRYPSDISENYVKRVIGVPGDHIHLVNKIVYLNGHPLTEPYVQHIFPNIQPYRDNFPNAAPTPDEPVQERALEMIAHHVWNGDLVVPPESYFAMGDNRDNSLDSRYWGFVPRENIIGKPLLIFWSYDAPTQDLVDFTANHFIDLAKNFFVKTRWDRELKLVRGYPIQ
ncbi:MAG TPA: signal peptidase I [Bryobacteraceae bacterium]